MSNGYIVAFRSTSETSGHKGIITWTSFPSKAAFDTSWATGSHAQTEVVEEGITNARAVELAHSTPIGCYQRAALADATNAKTGEIDLDTLQRGRMMVDWVRQDREERA